MSQHNANTNLSLLLCGWMVVVTNSKKVYESQPPKLKSVYCFNYSSKDFDLRASGGNFFRRKKIIREPLRAIFPIVMYREWCIKKLVTSFRCAMVFTDGADGGYKKLFFFIEK
ncbi:MAG: hypothetical protein AAF915_15255 [Cyanobacteria bacterium P01_D01_bin.50]